MSMVIVGTADQHVDSTMVGSWNADAGVHSNWIESFARLQDTVDICNERKADLMIVAGDTFHNGRPSAEAVHRYVQIMNGLNQNTKVIFTDGNHDQTSVVGKHKTPVAAYLSDHRWTHTTVSATEVLDFNGVSIAAVPWHRVAGENSLEKTASVLRDDVNRMSDIISDKGNASFLFGHFTVDEATFGSGIRSSELLMSTSALEATLSVNDLDKGPWSFWRAGHIHRHTLLGDKGGYLGSTYKVSFAEEDERKGVEVITLEEDGSYEHEFVPFRVRELTSVTLESGVDLSSLVASKQQERDILRIMLQSGDKLSPKSDKLVTDMRDRGVEVQVRSLPKERQVIRNVQVAIETDPREAMKTYAETNIDDKELRKKSISMFGDVMQSVSQ